MADKLFELIESDRYIYSLYSYNVSLSQLIVSVKLGDIAEVEANYTFLVWEAVEYIEAPKNWNGGHFYQGSEKELIDLFYDVGLYDLWMKGIDDTVLKKYDLDAEGFFRELARKYQLYIAKPITGKEIKIIAKGFFQTSSREVTSE